MRLLVRVQGFGLRVHGFELDVYAYSSRLAFEVCGSEFRVRMSGQRTSVVEVYFAPVTDAQRPLGFRV